MSKFKIVLLLTLLIAIIAPAWAAISGALGLIAGAVALVSAGIYVASGMDVSKGLKITLGFLAGNLWAFLVLQVAGALGGALNIPGPLLLFCVLFVFVIPAVFISMYLDKLFDLSAWLTAWAASLLVMSYSVYDNLELLLHLAIGMVAGIWLVGVGITSTHKYLVGKFSKAE
jgi:hypothetical protein